MAVQKAIKTRKKPVKKVVSKKTSTKKAVTKKVVKPKKILKAKPVVSIANNKSKIAPYKPKKNEKNI